MKMHQLSLKHGDAVFRIEESPGEWIVGYKQEWYPEEQQRISGCGPTVACAIMSYMMYGKAGEGFSFPTNRSDCLAAMEEAWRYVTPGDEGIPTAGMFCEGFLKYAGAKGLEVSAHDLDIPQDVSLRPAFSEVVEFITVALHSDVPVAFLNLCKGNICDLDPWHWVVIVSIEYIKDSVVACIMDEGRLFDVDLKMWYDTTVRGGGFAYFSPNAAKMDIDISL
ncbi:MAG: hypothetical protein PHG30_09895 [Eubacteriales bacterium]|nr:hypothetical protein [Eubacteriales bacterium]MDD3932115.1 hypothetical protein [Eubacteriales bacterium]HPF18840.1 hypothetical protein [Bacillota bacterium]